MQKTFGKSYSLSYCLSDNLSDVLCRKNSDRRVVIFMEFRKLFFAFAKKKHYKILYVIVAVWHLKMMIMDKDNE